MRVSRRMFVQTAAGAIAGCYAPRADQGARLHSEDQALALILDLGAGCALRESLEGYRAALGGQAVCSSKIEDRVGRNFRTVIVPGAGSMDPGTVRVLRELLGLGTNVLVESAGGFLSGEECAVHQRTLREAFGLMIGRPVDLWPGAGTIPYVNYSWPRAAMVRDFSRAVPVSAADHQIIARSGRLPLASRGRVGKGVLIFVGSPMGPALGAGDPEGRQWLAALASDLGRSHSGLFLNSYAPA